MTTEEMPENLKRSRLKVKGVGNAIIEKQHNKHKYLWLQIKMIRSQWQEL